MEMNERVLHAQGAIVGGCVCSHCAMRHLAAYAYGVPFAVAIDPDILPEEGDDWLDEEDDDEG